MTNTMPPIKRRFSVETLRGHRVSVVAETAVQAGQIAELHGMLLAAEKLAVASKQGALAVELGAMIAAGEMRWAPLQERAPVALAG